MPSCKIITINVPGQNETWYSCGLYNEDTPHKYPVCDTCKVIENFDKKVPSITNTPQDIVSQIGRPGRDWEWIRYATTAADAIANWNNDWDNNGI